MLKVANTYAGVGGNRLKWEGVDVTAVEYNEGIASVYADLFPQDKVIVADAHEWLLDNYGNFDFFWSSPPCPTHSQIRYNIGYLANRKYKKVKPVFPDMKLYEEIIFFQYYCKDKLWVVESTIPYYTPLIEGTITGGHIFWSNFEITPIDHGSRGHRGGTVETLQERKKINLDKYDIPNKRQVLRNCVEPEVGHHILLCAQHHMQRISGESAAKKHLSHPETLSASVAGSTPTQPPLM